MRKDYNESAHTLDTDFSCTLPFTFILLTFNLNQIFFNRYQLCSNFSGNWVSVFHFCHCKHAWKHKHLLSTLSFSKSEMYSNITSLAWEFMQEIKNGWMVCDTDFVDVSIYCTCEQHPVCTNVALRICTGHDVFYIVYHYEIECQAGKWSIMGLLVKIL